MKKVLIALAMLGLTASGAVAQTCHTAKTVKAKRVAHVTKNTTRSNTGDTYQVCREEGGYYACCVYKKNKNTLKSW